jgi:hypothetical protein
LPGRDPRATAPEAGHAAPARARSSHLSLDTARAGRSSITGPGVDLPSGRRDIGHELTRPGHREKGIGDIARVHDGQIIFAEELMTFSLGRC